MRKLLLILFLLLSVVTNSQTVGNINNTEVAMLLSIGETVEIPVRVNNVLDVKFIVDTGASESSIPLFIVNTLIRTDTVLKTDKLEDRSYILADGSVSVSRRIQLRSVQIGNVILNDVSFSVTDDSRAPLLIGQNILRQFKTVKFDYNTNTLILIK